MKLTLSERRKVARLPAVLDALGAGQAQTPSRISAAEEHAAALEQISADAERAAELEDLPDDESARWMALEDRTKAASERL